MYYDPFSPMNLYNTFQSKFNFGPLSLDQSSVGSWTPPADRFSQDQINEEIRKSQSRNFWNALAAGAMTGKGWVGISNALAQSALQKEDIRNERSKYYETLNAQARNDAIQERERSVRDKLSSQQLKAAEWSLKDRMDEATARDAAREAAGQQYEHYMDEIKRQGEKWKAEAKNDQERADRTAKVDQDIAGLSAHYKTAIKDPTGRMYQGVFDSMDKALARYGADDKAREDAKNKVEQNAIANNFLNPDGTADIIGWGNYVKQQREIEAKIKQAQLAEIGRRNQDEKGAITDAKKADIYKSVKTSLMNPKLSENLYTVASLDPGADIDPEGRATLSTYGFTADDFAPSEGINGRPGVKLSEQGLIKLQQATGDFDGYISRLASVAANRYIDFGSGEKKPGVVGGLGAAGLNAGGSSRVPTGGPEVGTGYPSSLMLPPALPGEIGPQIPSNSREVAPGSTISSGSTSGMSPEFMAAMQKVPPAEIARITAIAQKMKLSKEQYYSELNKYLMNNGYL